MFLLTNNYRTISDPGLARICQLALRSMYCGNRYVAFCRERRGPYIRLGKTMQRFEINIVDLEAIDNLRISVDESKYSHILPINQHWVSVEVSEYYPAIKALCEACYEVLDCIRPGWSGLPAESGVRQRRIQVVFVDGDIHPGISCPISTYGLKDHVKKVLNSNVIKLF